MSSKTKGHTVNNVLLVYALLTILLLSATHGGRVHGQRMAETTPYALPAESRLLQDLDCLAFTLPHVELLMPTKTPRSQARTLNQSAKHWHTGGHWQIGITLRQSSVRISRTLI